MIFTTESGLISIVSMLLIVFSGCSHSDTVKQADFGYEKKIVNFVVTSHKNGIEDYALYAESAFVYDSSEDYRLHKVIYERRDGEKVKIFSDSSLIMNNSISYYSNIRIELEDSMQMFTDSLIYRTDIDTVSTDDSILIIKGNDRMMTKGFYGDKNFKKITFYNPVVFYGKGN